MPPTSNRPGSARSAAAINDQIRAFWLRLGGRAPTVAERKEYEALVTAWAAAVRAEGQIAEAA